MKTTTAPTRPMRWLLLLSVTMLLLIAFPRSSTSQTNTDDDGATITMTGAELNAAIEAACFRARQAEQDLEARTDDLDACETERDGHKADHRSCESRNALLVADRNDRPIQILPRGVMALWDVTAITLAGISGYCFGAGCSPELTVGLVVGTSLIGAGRVLWEWIGRKKM